MRLAKYLAEAGIASRRQAEELIAAGRIKVNGKTITEQGYKINPDIDQVEYKGTIVERENHLYILLNKPAGYISSVYDPQGRPTVLDLVKTVTQRIYPVGRLDFDTEGLLILTNDGDFTNLMTHPRYGITKKYEAWVKGTPTAREVKYLEEGVQLEDGITAPAQVKILKKETGKTLMQIEIGEGRKREIKRMFAAVGHPVINLKRIAFSFLSIQGVSPGKYRYLTPQEVDRLKQEARG